MADLLLALAQRWRLALALLLRSPVLEWAVVRGQPSGQMPQFARAVPTDLVGQLLALAPLLQLALAAAALVLVAAVAAAVVHC